MTTDPQPAGPGRQAEAAQRVASDPAVSAFVAASAGSGKTKLLIDRLLRLMLGGADPARIQCLTYSKAAAAEMKLRLQQVLGQWITLDDAALDARLAALPVAPGAATRRRARELFAVVLDLPGGMRIDTIHAFCQSLLRRFPLEAALSPHFQLIEDSNAQAAMREAREAVLARADTPDATEALDRLTQFASLDRFAKLVKGLGSDPDRLGRLLALPPDRRRAATCRTLGLAHPDRAALIDGAVGWAEEAVIRDAARMLLDAGAPKVKEQGGRMLAWLALAPAARADAWREWREVFLRPDGLPRGPTALVNEKLAQAQPHLAAVMEAEQARVVAVEVAALSDALVTLAAPVLRAYHDRKGAGGLLDYDDLIGRTKHLLVDPGAAWVLYKLDGGLDHLLLDEVQDTAPAQWDIAGALTEEFFTGDGARDGRRTVFAVGDRKQSIFSFQGADPAGFDSARGRWRGRVQAAGQAWRDVALDVSFRSATPVLALVDAVFADPAAAAGVVQPGDRLAHKAFRIGHAGSVELWPLTPEPATEPAAPGSPADRNLTITSARKLLAEELAAWIAREIRADGAAARPLGAGDVMVLVRKRDKFAGALVRALKSRGVPVAGLDRLVLTKELAVQDLMALGDALLLPQDDLTVASVLTSPLGFLSDDSLMALAMGRDGTLWETLRARAPERADWSAAWAFLSTLAARVDYATPYALLAEALGPLGGRARLLARLGPEAAEPMDELLAEAMNHADRAPPSLQGFLHWLRQADAEIKREAEGTGGAVRIMTVHGAKGLQARLVILPDTTSRPKPHDGLLWAADAAIGMEAADAAIGMEAADAAIGLEAADNATGTEVPLYVANSGQRTARADLLAAAQTRQTEEENRLLYVALTRAEDRLLVCGWQPKTMPDGCWYQQVARGFAALDAASSPFSAWEGARLRLDCPQTVLPAAPPPRPRAVAAAALPPWAGAAPDWRPAPPPPEPARPAPLAPSRPDGAMLGPVPQAASPLAGRDTTGARFRRGQIIHALLQHLPALPQPDRAEAARGFASRPGHGLTPAAAAVVVAETLAILDHPDLAPLFGPEGRAEVPLTGVVAGAVVGGLVDRLAVLDGRVLLADFKTNRDPPARLADTPVLYLRQMAAYRDVLRAIFPGRAVLCALVWTQAARVSTLPDALLDAHAPGTAPPA